MSIGPLMVDIEGQTLSPADKEFLHHPAVGGVILFSRNFSSPQQLANLTTAIHDIRDPRLLIAVDQEGGRVQRFRDGFTQLPQAAWYGNHYQQQPTQALHLCELAGWIMATELLTTGVDFSFAPVLDLGQGPSQVIGDRAFSGEPQIVLALATAWMKGVHAAGMSVVGKHFPGHGSVPADSHLELPIDERPLPIILETDLIPFAHCINAGLDAIMPAHVLYPKVDNLPAGFSALWLQEILRFKLGFQGVIFSDDLSMGAAQIAGGYGARAKAALQAGCDMVLACNNRSGALEAAETLANHHNLNTNKNLSQMLGRPKIPSWDAMYLDPRWRDAVAVITAKL